MYSFGESIQFLDQGLALSISEFEHQYEDLILIDTQSSSLLSSYAFSGTTRSISLSASHMQFGPCVISRSISNTFLSPISIARFPSDVSTIFCLSHTSDHNTLISGTDGHLKNAKRVHFIDLERSEIIFSKALGKSHSDVLSLYSLTSPRLALAGLRNGCLYSFDWREPRSNTGYNLAQFSSGISVTLKPLSDYSVVVGTLHDQVKAL